MSVYYNEIDPFAAEWLRELMREGVIPDGEVDTRDIRDVYPDELKAFTHCHFFAGIGGWAFALRLAGWADDRRVWTGSCPCQPYSTAGGGGGFIDERHLWPAWFHLIERCTPPIVFGEQVEAAIKFGWLDLVSDDLEASGYAVAPIGLPASSVGAFHIRQRLWFVAESDDARRERRARRGASHVVGDAEREGLEGFSGDGNEASGGRARALRSTPETSATLGVGDADEQGREQRGQSEPQRVEGARGEQPDGSSRGAIASPWSDVVWLSCRDGKARATQPGIFPLAHGVPGRVGTLRGAGNAIVPQVAAEFIGAYLDIERGLIL